MVGHLMENQSFYAPENMRNWNLQGMKKKGELSDTLD